MYPYDIIEKIFGKKIEIFGFELKAYPYGMFIAIGILLCIYVMYSYSRKKGIPNVVRDFIFICAILAIALGFLAAKLYQAFYDFIETGKFDLSGAGITAMGGFIGGAAIFLIAYFVIGKFYFKGEQKGYHIKSLSRLAALAPCCITIAHAFGRIGCLMAGCCHGEYLGQDYVFGGLWMHTPDKGNWGYYVPTQLYEALFLFVLFTVLSILYFKKSNFTFPVYLISYGVWRIIIEIFRDDARGAFVLGLSPSQWQSIIFIAGGIIYLVIMIIKKIPFWNEYETIKKPKKEQKQQTES